MQTVATKPSFWGYFTLLAMANLIWAGQGTAVKFLNPHLGPIAITFLPFYIATVLLIPLLVLERRRNPKAVSPTWSDWRQFAAAGIFGQILAQLGMTWGVTLSLASNGAILNLLIPVITAVLASIFLREKITMLRIACLLVGLGGVFLLSVQDLQQSSFLKTNFFVGNLLILFGCFGSSFYNVCCKGLMARFEEIEILIFSYIVASVVSLPLLIWKEPFDPAAFAGFDWRAWLAFGFLALFMYTASMLFFFKALQHLPVTVASASLYLVPVFGVLIAWLFLGEKLSVTALCGTGIVLVSTVLIMRYDSGT
jgi:drug/metabolite transporter (DMT)-like permease